MALESQFFYSNLFLTMCSRFAESFMRNQKGSKKLEILSLHLRMPNYAEVNIKCRSPQVGAEVIPCRSYSCRTSIAPSLVTFRKVLKWGASIRWSIGPSSAMGIETTTIGRTHPTVSRKVTYAVIFIECQRGAIFTDFLEQ